MEETPRDPRGREVDLGLSMDVEGRFFIRGEPVTHVRTGEALTRGLHADADGSVCTRIGYEWCKVAIADTPLRVLGVELNDAALPWLELSDGTAERLEPQTLWLEGDRLYCKVRGRTLEARFLPVASAALLVRALDGDEERPVARFGEEVVELRVNKRTSRGTV